MAQFEVTAPDGRRFMVTAPPGASQDDVLRYAQTQFAQQPSTYQPSASSYATQVGAGFNARLPNVLGAPVDLVGRGLRAIGVPVPEDAIGGSASIRRGLEAITGPAPEARTTGERFARGAGAGLVDVGATLAPATLAARMVAPAVGAAPTVGQGVAQALASQPALQAASGAVGGGTTEATGDPLAGFIAGMAVPLGYQVGARAISPMPATNSPGRQALIAAADAEGIPLTAGQRTGSRFMQNIEAQLEQLPLTAGPQRAIRETAEDAFTRAAMSRTGANVSDVLPDTLNRERARIGGTIGAIANRNTMAFTPQLDNDLRQIEDSLQFLTAETAAPVQAYINRVRGMVVPGQAGPPPGTMMPPGATPPGAVPDTIPGASYRMMDSQLGRAMRSTSNGDLRAALGDIRERLRAAMDASISPGDAADWQEARRQYANLMTIATAAGRAGERGAEGRLSPPALREAVNQSTGRGYAFGRGDLNELARLGQSVLRPPPDSGTAGRTMANNILTGGVMSGGGIAGSALGGVGGGVAGAVAPLVLPRIAQMMINSAAGQAFLRNQLAAQYGVQPGALAAIMLQQAQPVLNAQ